MNRVGKQVVLGWGDPDCGPKNEKAHESKDWLLTPNPHGHDRNNYFWSKSVKSVKLKFSSILQNFGALTRTILSYIMGNLKASCKGRVAVSSAFELFKGSWKVGQKKIGIASKTNKMNKTMCLLSLTLGLFASVLVSSSSYGFQKNLGQKNRVHFGEDLGEFNPSYHLPLLILFQKWIRIPWNSMSNSGEWNRGPRIPRCPGRWALHPEPPEHLRTRVPSLIPMEFGQKSPRDLCPFRIHTDMHVESF